jgi:peptide/nickel transport system substrate-binding protein
MKERSMRPAETTRRRNFPGANRQTRRSSAGGAACVLLAALLAGCGGSSSAAGTSASGPALSGSTSGALASTLTIDMVTPPTSLDPANQCNITDGVDGNFYSRLVEFGTKPGPDGTLEVDQSKLVDGLARSWQVTDGGRVYTFDLRPGLRFANGDPITAQAAEFTFERVQKMDICSGYDVDTADTGDVISTKAVGPLTFQVTLHKPNPHLITSWATPALGIVDPKVVDAHGGVVAGQPNQYMATHTAGAGPYVASEYQPGVRLVMTANPNYYGAKPYTHQIVVNYITSDSTLQLNARSDAADVTFQMSKLGAKDLAGSGGLRVIPFEATNTEQVILNWKKPPLNNPRVREALAYAVPYQQLVEKVAQGYAVAFNGPILPTMPYFDPKLGAPHPYDMAKAKALLASSGVKTPISLTLTVPEGNPVEQQLATILQSSWAQIGVNVNIRTLSAAAYTTALFSNEDQAAMRNDSPFVNDPDYYLGYDLQCVQSGTENTGNICIPAADQEALLARRTASAAVAKAAYTKVIELWEAKTPKIFLYLDDQVVVLGPNVTRFTWDPGYSSFASIAKMR